MSNDTQNNKLTPDEEQFIEQIASTLKKHRDAEAINKAVKAKIAASSFSAKTNFIQTTAGRITAFAGLAVATLIVLLLISKSPEESQNNDEITLTSVDSIDNSSQKQTWNFDTNEKKKSPKKSRRKTKKQEKGAVPGLSIASSDNSPTKFSQADIVELSFFEEYKFNDKARIRTFRKDLKKSLEKLNIKFSDKSNREEVVNLVSQKTKGVDENQKPVIFYITAKVDKRFPGSLKVSLRYYVDENEKQTENQKTINTIFYNNLKARVSGLIHWKYKPKQDQ